MKAGLICVVTIATTLFAGISCGAGDFQIETIIEIGPVSAMPMSTPIQWSPDGTKISYFRDDGLIISDTLGNIELVHDFGLYTHRYLWLSNEEICLNLHEGDHKDSSLNKLIVFNIATLDETLVDQYIRYLYWHDKSNTTKFEGPFLTVNGNLYYYHITYKENSSRSGVLNENKWLAPEKSPPLQDDFVLRWHYFGLYKINLNNSDSTRLGPSPKHVRRGGANMNARHNAVLSGGTYVNLEDSTIMIIDSFIKNPLDSSYWYEVIFSHFNPRLNEILVDVAFDDAIGDRTVATMIGVFNLDSKEFTFIDSPANANFCGYPSYSPDGMKIAFIADYKGHIIYRGK